MFVSGRTGSWKYLVHILMFSFLGKGNDFAAWCYMWTNKPSS